MFFLNIILFGYNRHKEALLLLQHGLKYAFRTKVTCPVHRYQAEEEVAGTGGLEVRFGSIPCGCVSLECYAKE